MVHYVVSQLCILNAHYVVSQMTRERKGKEAIGWSLGKETKGSKNKKFAQSVRRGLLHPSHREI